MGHRSDRTARGLLAAALILGVAALGHISKPVAADAADGDVIFRIGVLQDIDNLNPFKGITAAAYEAWSLMYDELIGYAAEDFAPTPGLAESWEESEDGLTWTYHIREGVQFHDGKPLTADDVAYTFNRIMDGQLEQTNYGSYVAQIKSVEATDDFTVVMTLKQPAAVMERLAVPILPEHIWSEIDDEELRQYTNEPDSDPKGGVGSGPFILTEAREGQFYRFETNPDYWDGPAKIDGLEYRLYRNADAMVQALKNDEIDFADDLDANVFAALEGVDGITTRSSEYSGWNYLTMNGGAALVDGTPIGTGHPSLKDPEVRRAIHYAVDKEALVDRTLDGRGSPGTTIIPPLYPELHAEPENLITYDPDEANRILDEAGYARGDDGIRTMPDGSDPLVYTLYARSNSETSQTTIQFLQGWLEDIGIDSTAETVSETRLYEIAGEGTFDMYEWGWITEPDPDYQLSALTCGQFSYDDNGTIYPGLNDTFWCNEEYDDLYQQQATETDPVARAKIVKQMQLMAYDATAYIVTEYYDYLQAYRSDNFTGFVPQPDPDGAILFQYGTYSYLNIEPPTSTATSADDDSGSNSAMWIGGVAGASVLAAAGLWFFSRRRRDADADVE